MLVEGRVNRGSMMGLTGASLWQLDRLALPVADLQQDFDDTGCSGKRNSPECEVGIGVLLDEWRRRRPVVFARDDSVGPRSPPHPDRPGKALQVVLSDPPDPLVTKTVNSCFHGAPHLDRWLRDRGLAGFVICGITTNHCCETTARVGGSPGHTVLFALDATYTFDRQGPDGTTMSADELTRARAINLHGDFATVVTTAALVAHAPGAVESPDGPRLS